MWLPSAFQQANNWTRLHFNMILFALISGIPLMIFATAKFGVIGGTVIWVIHGISELTLQVDKTNVSAVSLYKKFNFIIAEEKDSLYLIMKRTINVE